MMIEEGKRTMRDALCVVPNLVLDDSIDYDGGSIEIECSFLASEAADQTLGIEQYAVLGFAADLDSAAIAVEENFGLPRSENLR